MRNSMPISIHSGIAVNRRLYQALALSVVLFIMPMSAGAVKWEPLARTALQDVAIDTDSVRLTNLSRLAVWLRFTPFGEQQRKLAGAENNQKFYRLHLEYYEIDCSEQSAVLGMVDILGPAGKRLERKKGGGPPEPIIPGSVLDLAARKVCPDLEENKVSPDDEIESPDSEPAAEVPKETQPSDEARKMIAEAIQKTERNPKDLDAWRELGNAYYDADMPSQSIAAYNRALAIKPDDTDILNDQGSMYRQAGEIAHALANFEKARKADPRNLESLYNSAYVLAFDLNRMDKALVLWRTYLTLDQTSETSRQVQSFIERYGNSSRK